MRRALRTLVLMLCCAAPLGAQDCPPGPLALVLAGGGAKGFAHLGVFRTMDSLGIRPDLIVGTSIGSIMGALYASGLSAQGIDSVTRSAPFTDPNRTAISRGPHQWGSLAPLVLMEQQNQGFRLVNGGSWEYDTNAMLNRILLRGNLLARGDFDRLPIPFRAVATDLRTREAVVFAKGDLAQVVRASIAIPLVFSPEEIDGRFYTDGGISANVPIAAARAAGARRLIVVDLKEAEPDSGDFASPAAVAGRLTSFLFTQPLEPLGPDDAYIWPDVRGFGNLDFAPDRRAQLIANGRAAADSILPRMRCVGPKAPASVPPLPTSIADWRVSNGTPQDGVAMGKILGLSRGEQLDLAALDRGLADLPFVESFRELWLGPAGAGHEVSFNARTVPAARRVAGLGLAYDHDLGGRLWLGAMDRSLQGAVESSALVALGRFRSDVTGSLSRPLGVGRSRVSPQIALHLGLDDVRSFTDSTRDYRVLHTRTADLFAGMEWARVGNWSFRAGVQGVVWRSPDRDTRATGGIALQAGTDPRLRLHASAEATLFGDYRLARVAIGSSVVFHGVSLEPAIRLGIGQHLPVQVAFDLGGEEGFPGVRAGERRGDREALARVQGTVPLFGPVAFRVLIAAGRSGEGGGILGGDGWLAGIRSGLAGNSPIGTVAFEYGVASSGSRAAFIRVGRWF